MDINTILHRWFMCKLILCLRLADSDITDTSSVKFTDWLHRWYNCVAHSISSSTALTFLTSWGRNINLHHLVQCKWNWWKTVGTEEKSDTIRRLKKGEWSVTYVGYPESKFRRATKKKQEYITNPVYCHLMYILYTTFWQFPPLLWNLS